MIQLFFAKFAKFHFYKPNTLIITSIEFDHADIYPDLNAIKVEFQRLIEKMPAKSTIIACVDQEGVRDFISNLGSRKLRLITYGERAGAGARIKFSKSENGRLEANFNTVSNPKCKLSLSIPGRYNLKNAVACVLALEAAGISVSRDLLEKFSVFKGVNRRQQIWLETPITLIEDFAHHPSAVRETLEGMREWFPGKRLIAVFEPRSNTSRKKIFQSYYVSAFKQADFVIMKEVDVRTLDKSDDLFDVKVVCDEISKQGIVAKSFDSIDEIQKSVWANAQAGDVVVVMSNGSFGGLIEKLAKGSFSSGPGA